MNIVLFLHLLGVDSLMWQQATPSLYGGLEARVFCARFDGDHAIRFVYSLRLIPDKPGANNWEFRFSEPIYVDFIDGHGRVRQVRRFIGMNNAIFDGATIRNEIVINATEIPGGAARMSVQLGRSKLMIDAALPKRKLD